MYTTLLVSYSDFFDSPGEIPFMFKKAGQKVVIYCCETSWLKSNRYHDEWIDASKEKEVFAKEFISLVKEKGDSYNKIMLLDDVTIQLINETIGDEEALFAKVMPINKIENREMLSSKIGMSRVFEKHNIATPRYINYVEESNFATVSKKLNFPVLLKVDFSFSGTGIRKCNAPEELEEKLNELHDTKNIVIQEFITGEDIGVEALFENGELIRYQCAKVAAYMYNEFSFTTKRFYVRNHKIEELLRELGKKTGLNSFASIGYIYHKERDTYYLIEVDARTNSWMPYSRFTNDSFIDGLREISSGVKTTKATTAKEKEKVVEIALFDRDMRRCFKMKDFKGILKWIFNYKGYWKFIPLYDTRYFGRVMRKMIFDLLH
ncbi:ATP-grasp domain-containing protein [Parasediminibacterium sp. JCM 36343]|uniref:ATP-grasp domain-containing protein n=1 Tax=Parasediminibacterium sp. JCM 36343 TaxID=3374279 RepID=UPI00397CEEB7